LNAMFLGIIGEYLGRIFMQSKRRPVPIIEATLNGASPAANTRRISP
jgi:polyisoprenyl-phosphate glycosyltransferase